MRHFLLLPCPIARLAGGMLARAMWHFLVALTCIAHLAAAGDHPARPTIDLAALTRRANREIYTAKPAPEVVPDSLESALQSHGHPSRKTLDKSPLSCGNPPWQTALRWLEQARGALSPNCTPRACWPRRRKGAANCLNCKEIAGRGHAGSEMACAVAQVPETYGFMPLRDSGWSA